MIQFPIMFEIKNHEELDIIQCAISEFHDSDNSTEIMARNMEESLNHIQTMAMASPHQI